jgi:3-hydroxyisobutyrate dehydrogenase-like beta-hydroxyacid dehydrogenase
MRIGVVGLGRMGLPIARRLASHHEVRGFDIDPARSVAARAAGIEAAEGIRAAVAEAELVVTVLPGPEELRAALDGGGLFAHLPPGAVWIDVTSCDPDTGAELHAAAAAHGVVSIAAPMLGGPEAAEHGGLGFLIAGSDAARRRARPLLAELGPPERMQIVDDAPTHAYLVKLLGNLLWFGQVVAVTEALLVAQRSGIDPEATARLLAAGPGSSAFLTQDAPKLFRGDLMESFGLDRVVEELRHVQALADSGGSPFALSRVVTSVHEGALDRYGARPGELLASLLLQEDAGVRLSEREEPA